MMSVLIRTRSNNNHDERHLYKLVLIADNVKALAVKFNAHILFQKRRTLQLRTVIARIPRFAEPFDNDSLIDLA